ncbi:hypothetical protein TWF696_006179 [Orbilia brochopaga]|uniref:Uncharacterized protein n=1 Tax=Orbilia brochopaga TaxID=3140254 RepID=A0AAV9UVF0_9PEZI
MSLQATVDKNNEIFQSFLKTLTIDTSKDGNSHISAANQNNSYQNNGYENSGYQNDYSAATSQTNTNHSFTATAKATPGGYLQYSNDGRRRGDYYRPIYDDNAAWPPRRIHNSQVDPNEGFASSAQTGVHVGGQVSYSEYTGPSSYNNLRNQDSSSVRSDYDAAAVDDGSSSMPMDQDDEIDDEDYQPAEADGYLDYGGIDEQADEHDGRLQTEIAQGLAWVVGNHEGVNNGQSGG